MDLMGIWQKFTIAGYQLWVWAQYELGAHPYLVGGTIIVVILAFTLYKMEVRAR